MPEPELIEDPLRRQRYRFRRRGEALEAEVWADPGGDVPEHFHPRQEERFEVVAGRVQFRLAGKRTVVGPGARLTAPAGTAHAFENIGADTAHLIVTVEPALSLREFLEDAAALARAGKYTRRGIPKGPRAALELAELADRYREITVMTRPPRVLQRLFIPPLARLDRYLKRRSRR